MTRHRKPTLRGNIFDMITLLAVVVLVLGNTAGAVFHLIATPDRPAWQIALDWITIAIFVVGVLLALYLHRRAMKVVYQVEAQRRALHAKIRQGRA